MRSKLKYLPAALGWAFLLLGIAFALSVLLVKPARAEDAVLSQDSYTCAPHKVLWFTWGWDCAVPSRTNTLTLKTDAGSIFCNDIGSECKTTTKATLRVNGNALAGLADARHFDLAMRCTTTPHDPSAQCDVAIKSEGAK